MSPKIDNSEPLSLELADFTAMVRAGEAPDWQVELGRDVAHLTEAAEESLRRGGAEVSPTRSRLSRLVGRFSDQ